MRRGRLGTSPQSVDGRHHIGSLQYLPSNSLRSGWMPNGRGLPLVDPGHTVATETLKAGRATPTAEVSL
jgi:hypothetical protein